MALDRCKNWRKYRGFRVPKCGCKYCGLVWEYKELGDQIRQLKEKQDFVDEELWEMSMAEIDEKRRGSSR